MMFIGWWTWGKSMQEFDGPRVCSVSACYSCFVTGIFHNCKSVTSALWSRAVALRAFHEWYWCLRKLTHQMQFSMILHKFCLAGSLLNFLGLSIFTLKRNINYVSKHVIFLNWRIHGCCIIVIMSMVMKNYIKWKKEGVQLERRFLKLTWKQDNWWILCTCTS